MRIKQVVCDNSCVCVSIQLNSLMCLDWQEFLQPQIIFVMINLNIYFWKKKNAIIRIDLKKNKIR